MKITFYIAMKDGSFIKSEGRLLSNDIVAHKVAGVDWRLTDYRSGMSIKHGLKNLKECSAAVESMPEDIVQSLKDIRQSDKYKAHCQKLLEYVKQNQ